MHRALLLLCIAASGCAANPPAAPPKGSVREVAAAACIEKEIGARGIGPIVVRFLLDDDGDLLSTEDVYDDVRVAFRRAPLGQLLSYEVTQRGVTWTGKLAFGARGELASLRLGSTDGSLDVAAELEWNGTFAKSTGTALPFAGLGGIGGTIDDKGMEILSTNLNVRQGGNPMAPVSFSGTVTITKQRGPRETYEYEDGRLQRWRDERGGETTYVWDSSVLPIETHWCRVEDGSTAPSCGSSRSVPLAGGGTRETIAGDPPIVLDYDAEGRIVRGAGGRNDENVVWRACQSFKPLRSP